MKNNYFKHLFTMLLLLCATVTSAHEQKVDTTANKMAKSVGFITSIDQPDFNVDGIYYNIKDSSATVEVSSTYYFTGAGWEPSPSYSGDVVIPENVTYDGETFKVIGIRGFAFYGCKNLTSVKIPVSIETVGVEAFRGCTGLTAVYIDDLAAWCNIGFATEADLPSWASPEMSSNPLSYSNKLYLKQAGQYSLLTRLYIPFGVTKINGVAFAGSDIESVTIPNSVKVISVGAFMECTNLRSVNLSNSVTSIEWYAFGGCTGLEEIHSLSSKPATIEEDAFTGYSATLYVPGGAKDAYKKAAYWNRFANIVETVDKDLEFTITSEDAATVAVTGYTGNSSSVIIPSHCTINGKRYTVTSIGNNAFDGYRGLTSITIPNSVTSIGDYAFGNCEGLTSIEIPNSVTSIGWYAFQNCTNLSSVVIGNSVTSIGGSAFKGTAWYDNQPDGVVYTGNVLYEYKGTMPSNTSVVVKDGTLGIGNFAFDGCSGLTSITIPNSVTSIGNGAFRSCSGLTSIEIPNSVISIGTAAFYNCSGLTSVTIPNSVTSIERHAFGDCSELKEVHINDLSAWCNISFGDSYANPLYYAKNLYFNGKLVTELVIPDDVKEIKDYAFRYCSALTSITIPNGVTSIGYEAFYGCSGLNEVHINDLSAWCNISFGGYDANPLSYAENLYLNGELVTDLVIPDDVKEIKDYAFGGCSGLTSITIPNSVTSIGERAFRSCSGLKSITIPSSVTSIGNSAFQYCSGLTSITIPNSVTSIGNEAFYYCSGLTSITIPNGVTSIGDDAFYGCSGLKEIYSLSAEPARITSTTFYNYSATLYVPECTKKIYENETEWSRFTNIVEIEVVDKDLEFTITSEDAATVAVTGYTGNKSSVIIPSHCTINGKRYTVTSIGNNAFGGYRGLASIKITNTVTSIGESAFNSCSGLTSLEIPNSVTSIGYNAFVLCTGLKSIEIPGSVTNIENSAFSSCSGLESIVVAEENTVYDSRNNCNAIIETATNTLLQGCQNTTVPSSVTGIGHSAFYLCTALKSIEIANSVTTIADYAFGNCEGLTSIEIPNSVTSIGKSAFLNCTNLSSVVIGNGVTSIGEGAFSGCRGLTSIEIGNNVENIGDYAFYGCSGLTGELVIPGSVTSIGDYAFRDCKGLTSVEIGNGVTFIGESAFYGCSGLTGELVIPNSVTSIGNSAFQNCTNLSSVVIGNGVTSIGDYAFYGCSGLTGELVIPNSVTSIESCAFEGCSGLTGGLVIPNSVTTIESRIFYGCSGLTSVEIPNSVRIIGDDAFSGCSGLTSVEIPNSVTYIGSNAFRDCEGLTSVEIPNSVTYIGSDAFLGTVWFDNQPDGIVYAGKVLYAHKGTMPENTSVTVKEGTLSITDDAFKGCTGLASIEIPSSVTKIGFDAFYGCAELKTVVNFSELTVSKGSSNNGYIAYYADKVINAPNGFVDGDFAWGIDYNGVYVLCSYLGDATELTLPTDYKGENYKIGNSAFQNCTNLSSVEIGNNVEYIGDYAFYGCSGLTGELVIPNSVISIGGGAFQGCSGLTGELVIPNGVAIISNGAFNGCSGLTSVEIPNSVRIIEDDAFSGCSGLTSVEIPNSVTNIGSNAFRDCEGLTSVVIGNGVTSIGDYAFERCSALASVELPVSLRSIGENAFARCTSLVSVLICENVENIGAGAFNSCNKLKSITSLIPAEKLFAIPGLVTTKIYRTCTLYVHIGAGETYAATEGWSRFVNIVEQDLSDIEDVLGEDLDNAVFYDLNGRVVEYPTNGIYIVNGKKVLVK